MRNDNPTPKVGVPNVVVREVAHAHLAVAIIVAVHVRHEELIFLSSFFGFDLEKKKKVCPAFFPKPAVSFICNEAFDLGRREDKLIEINSETTEHCPVIGVLDELVDFYWCNRS